MKKYFFLIILILLLAFGCQKYTKKPIDRQKMVKEAETVRELLIMPNKAFTFDELLEVVSQNNADLQLVKSQYLQQEKIGLVEGSRLFLL